MADSSATDSGCYLDVVKRLQTLPDATSPWRVTRGILDSSNRDSLLVAAPVPVGAQTRFTWPLQPTEHVFKAGHQIGVVLDGQLRQLRHRRDDGHGLHARRHGRAR